MRKHGEYIDAICFLRPCRPWQFGEEAVKEGMGGGGGGGPADIFDLFGMGGGRRAPRERRSEDVVHK